MSKLSQLHAELTQQAYRLGYSSLDNALADGYVVDYMEERLVDGRELAHEEYNKRKEKLLKELRELCDAYAGAGHITEVLEETINFIKEGEA